MEEEETEEVGEGEESNSVTNLMMEMTREIKTTKTTIEQAEGRKETRRNRCTQPPLT